MYIRLMVLVLSILFVIPLASALDSEYTLIVEENGNALVVIEATGEGVINVPLPQDSEYRVQGALYFVEDDMLVASIGSTQKAIIAYTTHSLTSKQSDGWSMVMDFPNETELITVALPSAVQVNSMQPTGLREDSEFTKLLFRDTDHVEISYTFDLEIESINEPVAILTSATETEKNLSLNALWAGLITMAVLAVVILLLFVYQKKNNKANVMRTLASNEKKIVQVLLQHKGIIRRNVLEKETKLAKSSLAHTLTMLEHKKIVEVDKTHTTHIVRFTRWFHEL